MRKLILSLLVAVALFNFIFSSPALAGDAANGAKIFSANCAACHAGGKNYINPAKTLSKSDLEKYSMASLEKIVAQVTNGKAAMPSFKSKLNADQIEDVATYVLEQAEKGW
ncbi:MAG: c-type cytochrome [Oscillatoria sp. PMC 1068.18]|nr:c-type cytochrome [Oscillatoria sp. PMC 1076.18]MEC4991145.1 c-type cytochrome [Oscillatoria sp. PMC 1068.18]